MSFQPARHGVVRSMSLDRKAIGYQTRIVSEPIYENETSQKYDYEDAL